MRWLLHHVLVLLTVSQRLLILDTTTMQVTASSDLLMKQILHYDRFSSHMNNFPAIADAYYHSFHTYKQKIFLLVPLILNFLTLVCWRDLGRITTDMGRSCPSVSRGSRFHRSYKSHDLLLPWKVCQNHSRTTRRWRGATCRCSGQTYRFGHCFIKMDISSQGRDTWHWLCSCRGRSSKDG